MSCNQFQRTELLIGSAGLKRLRQSVVAVVGCGAVGSFAVEALARAGVGNLILIDGDEVQETNINRQLCAFHSTIGQKKVSVLANRILDICPETRVTPVAEFIHAENLAGILTIRPDFVVDAIDVLADKVDLIRFLQDKHIPFISSMGAALKTDFRQIQIAPLNQTHTCPLAARLRKELKKQGADLNFPTVFSAEHPQSATQKGRQMGSLVSMTGMFGLVCATYVIKDLIK